MEKNKKNHCEPIDHSNQSDIIPFADCKKNEIEIDKLVDQTMELQKAFEDELGKEIIDRPNFLKGLLRKLSPATQMDLCNHSGGFVLITGCKN